MYDPSLVPPLVAAAARHKIEITVEPRRILYPFEDYQYTRWGAWLGIVTDEILTDLTAYFENATEETVMNIYSTDLFTYLAGDMIGANTITLTISGFSQEKMNSGRGGEQLKPCLHFKERSKLMVLNKTNAKMLAGELGPETDNWIGARVTIAAPVVDAFGKSARSLRVIKVEPPARAQAEPKPRPAANGAAVQQQPTPEPAEPVAQDDLFPAEALPFVDPA